MAPLLCRLGDGPFFTLLAGITGIGGVAAIGLIRMKGMEWRLQREAKINRLSWNAAKLLNCLPLRQTWRRVKQISGSVSKVRSNPVPSFKRPDRIASGGEP